MLIKSKILFAACFLSVAAYAHDSDEKDKKITLCKEPRPQMCTMDYTPVCGLVNNNMVKTFGNACGACGELKVSAYITNECQSDSLKYFDLENQTNKDSKKKN